MSIYDIIVKNRKGEDVSLADFKGKVVARYSPTYKPEDMEGKIVELLK